MGEYGGKALPEFGFRVYDSGLVKGFLVMCRVFGLRVYDLGSVKGVLAVFFNSRIWEFFQVSDFGF